MSFSSSLTTDPFTQKVRPLPPGSRIEVVTAETDRLVLRLRASRPKVRQAILGAILAVGIATVIAVPLAAFPLKERVLYLAVPCGAVLLGLGNLLRILFGRELVFCDSDTFAVQTRSWGRRRLWTTTLPHHDAIYIHVEKTQEEIRSRIQIEAGDVKFSFGEQLTRPEQDWVLRHILVFSDLSGDPVAEMSRTCDACGMAFRYVLVEVGTRDFRCPACEAPIPIRKRVPIRRPNRSVAESKPRTHSPTLRILTRTDDELHVSYRLFAWNRKLAVILFNLALLSIFLAGAIVLAGLFGGAGKNVGVIVLLVCGTFPLLGSLWVSCGIVQTHILVRVDRSGIETVVRYRPIHWKQKHSHENILAIRVGTLQSFDGDSGQSYFQTHSTCHLQLKRGGPLILTVNHSRAVQRDLAHLIADWLTVRGIDTPVEG